VIHNAIDTDDYCRRRSRHAAKVELAAPVQGRLLGAVGRLSPEKGFDLLIRAVARLRQAGGDLHLWIAGDGPAAESLQRLIDELGCRDCIRLLGHVADPKLLFEAMDAFVLSSTREGLPNVVLEAMAMETPVIATRTAGVPMLVSDGLTGLLVEPGSVDCLTEGIARLCTDELLANRLAQAARSRIEDQFSFARRMEKIVRIYDEVLQRNAS
jgi:glycosyltransferase involved in cell wall biosynthesis